jgi:hypothetical protein
LMKLAGIFSIVEWRPLGAKSGVQNASRRCFLVLSGNVNDAELGRAFSGPAPPAAWSPPLRTTMVHIGSLAIFCTPSILNGSSHGKGDLLGSIYPISLTIEAMLPGRTGVLPTAIMPCARRHVGMDLSDVMAAASTLTFLLGMTLMEFEGGTHRLGRTARA